MNAIHLSAGSSCYCGQRLQAPQHPAVRRAGVAQQARCAARGGKQEKGWTRPSDFANYTDEQTAEEVDECRRKLFNLGYQLTTRQAVKGSDFRKLRKQIAHLLHAQRLRQIADGLTDNREYRRLERHKRVEAGFGRVPH